MLFTWDDAELDDINKAVPVRSKNIDSTTPVQADESMVFFDPVYRQIQFENDEDGKPAGKYPDVIHGIRVTAETAEAAIPRTQIVHTFQEVQVKP